MDVVAACGERALSKDPSGVVQTADTQTLPHDTPALENDSCDTL